MEWQDRLKKYLMQGEIVSINGKIFKPDEAKISVFDRGFLYGDSVYEVCRGYDGVYFALEDHIERLFKSGHAISMDMQMQQREYMAEIYRVAHEAGIPDNYMRLIVTRGEGPISLDPFSSPNLNIVIIIKKLEGILNSSLYSEGIDIITAKTVRNSKNALDPNIKSGNYLNNILALAEAKKKKVFDAILLNQQGFVTEGTTSNFYMVKDKTIYTAPEPSEILHGITRSKIKHICKSHKLQFVEKLFKPEEVYGADEAFTSGSVKEILPVKHLDGKKIGTGIPGPVTQALMGYYSSAVKDYCRAFRKRFEA